MEYDQFVSYLLPKANEHLLGQGFILMWPVQNL